MFYVGKGDDARLRRVIRNKHHTHIAQRYGLNREIVLATSVEQVTLDVEIELIAKHKTFVKAPDYVFGCNYTAGGDGISGYRYTEAQRERTSAGQRRSWADLSVRERRIAARNRPDVNDKLRPQASMTMRGKWADPSYRTKQIAAITEAQNDLQTQMSRKASNAYAATKQWRDKRDVMLAALNSDEYREKQRQAHVGKPQCCGLCRKVGHKRSTCSRGN